MNENHPIADPESPPTVIEKLNQGSTPVRTKLALASLAVPVIAWIAALAFGGWLVATNIF